MLKEPVLYREMFPYSSVPKVVFEDRIIQANMPKDIWLTDTTFRDGQQSRPPYTPNQIADIFDFMHRMSGPNGVIRQTEFFLYSEKDREAVRLCQERAIVFPRSPAGSGEQERLQAREGDGAQGNGHPYVLLGLPHLPEDEPVPQGSAQGVPRHRGNGPGAGIVPRCHLEDITRADFYGFVIPFVQDLMKLSEAAKMPVKVRACDTMGYGFPFPGTSLPRGVPEDLLLADP